MAALFVCMFVASCSTERVSPAPQLPAYFAEPHLTVGVLTDVPGFSDGDKNPSGFDIDLAAFIGNKLGIPATTHPLNVGDRDPQLKGRIVNLVIATYSITPQRNDMGIDFAGPYLVTPQAFLIRANQTNITDTASLQNKSICTTEGSTAALVTIPGAQVNTLPTNRDCVNLLAANNADTVFTDEAVLYGYMRAFPGKFKVVLSGALGTNQYYGLGLRGGNRQACDRLNEAIDEFLLTEWLSYFQNQLPAAVATYSGSDPQKGTFESKFKPKSSDKDKLSCKLS